MLTIDQIEAHLDAVGLTGHDYLEAADRALRAAGYAYLHLPCSCADGGEHGHHFACGWGPVADPADYPQTEEAYAEEQIRDGRP